MKKNLIKILALSAIALSLSSCNLLNSNKESKSEEQSSQSESSESVNTSSSSELVPVAEEVTLDEVFEWDATAAEFAKAGQLVVLKQLCVYARWGNTIIVGVPYASGGSILSLHGIEVNMDAQPDWQGVTLGRYANVDAEGVVENVNGRPVLKDAKVTINAEAQYDDNGNRIEDDGAYSAAYWGTSVTIRTYWDQYMGRSMSGILMEGIFQIASVPAEITAETSADFKVVFPGENTNGEDANNEYLINVHVPAGLSESAVAAFNSKIAGRPVGDFIDMMGMSRFDSTKKGMGFVLDDYWTRYAADVPESSRPTILTDWAEIQNRYAEKLLTPLPDLAHDDVFSYILTDAYAAGPESFFDDDTLAGLAVDPEKCGAVMIDMNCGSMKVRNVLADSRNALVEAGWELDEELSDESAKDFYYVLKNEDKAVAEINIWASTGAKAVSLIFVAERCVTTADTETLTAALAVVQARLGEKVEGYASALQGLPAAADAALSAVHVDWKAEDAAEDLLVYTFTLTPNAEVLADDDAIEAYADNIAAYLLSVGFENDFAIPAIMELDGFFNATSSEFVSIFLNSEGEGEEEHYTTIEMVLAFALEQDYVVYDVSDDSQWTNLLALNYLYATFSNVFGQEPGLYAASEPFYVDCGCSGAFTEAQKSQLLGVIGYLLPACATYAGQSEVAEDGSVSYDFIMNSSTEGNVILLEVYWDFAGSQSGTNYFYFGVLIGDVTPE